MLFTCWSAQGYKRSVTRYLGFKLACGPGKQGWWERAFGRALLSPDSGCQCKQTAPPGSVGEVRRINYLHPGAGRHKGGHG